MTKITIQITGEKIKHKQNITTWQYERIMAFLTSLVSKEQIKSKKED